VHSRSADRTRRIRTNPEFLADLDVAFATAARDDDFDRHVEASMAEVMERGLQEQANSIVRKHRARLAENNDLGAGWMAGHAFVKGIHVVAPPGMPRAEIAAVLRGLAASLEEKSTTAPSDSKPDSAVA